MTSSRCKKSTNMPRGILIVAVVLLATAGLALIGNGIWIKAKAQLAQILLNQAFERVQGVPALSDINAKPWSWADIKPIARLSAPRLNQSAIVLNNSSGEALAFGPGHLPGTPLPGDRGTSVISAHRDTHFSWIKNLKKDDRIEVENADGTLVQFSVKRSWIAPYDASGINADTDNTLLALATCYPFDAKTPGPLRYIVEAELVDNKMEVTSLEQR